MRALLKPIAAAAALSVGIPGSPALAGGQSGTVSKLEIVKSANYVVVNLTGSHVSPPACATQPGRWALKTSDGNALNDKIYSLFLTAQATGRTVAIGGTGTCTAVSSIEDIDAANIN